MICSRGGYGEARGVPIFGITKTIAFSTNAHSRFGSVVPNGVLGPPRILRYT